MILPCLLVLNAYGNNPKQIQIAFRLDDYSEISDTSLELKIIDLFRRTKNSFTLGVIPFVSTDFQVGNSSPAEFMLGEKKAKILMEAASDGTVEIAIHGYNHRSNHTTYKAEFLGIDHEEQLRRITLAKRHVEQITASPTTTFIPPWNQYNADTVRVLQSLNFNAMSAEIARAQLDYGALKLIPHTCEIRDLERAIARARASDEPAPLIVLMMHEYDFLDNNKSIGVISFQAFEQLIERLTAQSDITIQSLAKAVLSKQHLTSERFILNHKIRKAERRLPSWMTFHKEFVYRSTPNRIWHILYGFYGLMFVLAVFVTMQVCKFGGVQRRALHWAAVFVILSVGLGAVVHMVAKDSYPPSKLTITVVSAGSVVGLLLYSLHRLKRLPSATPESPSISCP